MGLFSRKQKEPELPDNLFDRIGTAAAAIQFVLHKNGLSTMPRDPDICIWENCGYILAVLKEAGIIHSYDALMFTNKMKGLYQSNAVKASQSFIWITASKRFYAEQVDLMMNDDHKLPDVIVYNLTHPSQNKKYFDDIPMFEIDFFKIQAAWAYISDIMGHFFFRNDEDIHSIPTGF